MLYLKQSTASQSVLIGPFVDDTDGKTAETGLTIANTDIRLSKNGGNMAAKNSGGGTHDEAGWYAITLDATDTNTVGRLQLSVDVAGALPVWDKYQVIEEAVYDAMYAASAAGPLQSTTAGRKLDVTANGEAGLDFDNTAGTLAAAQFAADFITGAKIAAGAIAKGDQLTGLNDPTAAVIADAVLDEALSGHQAQGTAGAAITMTAYLGPFGPGVFINDGAANTGTTLGDDGTHENPVSTIAAATTIASNLGVQLFYLINDTVITLAQAYEGYTFVGLGLSNKITLGSSDVDNSEFHNVILTGTQGGTGQIHAIGCSLTALVSAEIIAEACWLAGNNTLRAATNHIFKFCCSAVAGQSTPDLTFPGSGTTEVSFRHYSGGLTVKNATTNDTMSYEANGQLIIDASCTSLTVSVRGNCQITDNGTTTSLTQEAAINLTNINAEIDTALATTTYAEPAAVPAATSSIKDKINWLFALARNKGTQTSTTKTLRNDADGADIASSTISDDSTTFTRGEWT
jgi:hypothetical protein